MKPEHRQTVGDCPYKGDVPALAGLILGVGAVVALISGQLWKEAIVTGILAGIAGIYGFAVAGKDSVNRIARLTGSGAVLLGGFSVVSALYQAPPTNGKQGIRDLRTASGLESAIGNFWIEYGALPDVGRTIVATDSPDGVRLLKILLGMEGSSTARQNIRDIKLISVREGKKRRNGLIYSEDGSSVEGLFDSHGNGYVVMLNPKPEEPLRFSFGGRVVELKERECAVFSPGEDGRPGTRDDVTTW